MAAPKQEEISEKQLEVLLYIIRHIEEFGFQPSIVEIGHHFGVDKRAIYGRMKLLEQKGFILMSGEGRDRAVILHGVAFKVLPQRKPGQPKIPGIHP